MFAAPNMLATGSDWRIVNASSRTSEHKSISSPDLQARFRKANANERAVREPIWAKPAAATEPVVLVGELKEHQLFPRMCKHVTYVTNFKLIQVCCVNIVVAKEVWYKQVWRWFHLRLYKLNTYSKFCKWKTVFSNLILSIFGKKNLLHTSNGKFMLLCT